MDREKIIAEVKEDTKEDLRNFKNKLGMTQASVAGIAIEVALSDKSNLVDEVVKTKKKELKDEFTAEDIPDTDIFE